MWATVAVAAVVVAAVVAAAVKVKVAGERVVVVVV